MPHKTKVKVAINGYGRIGRNILRAWIESKRDQDIDIVAINDLGDPQTLAHLTQYDSTHGIFPGHVAVSDADRALMINQHSIKVFSERAPEKLPWRELGIDIVLECTGLFTNPEKAALHLQAGAKKVLISAPSTADVPTIVYGVNHQSLKSEQRIVSNASCTTNCLVPVVKPLHDQFVIESGLMTTIHAYTNDQVLSDVYHSDLRRARSATQSMIPTKTGAASAIGLVLPELNGKLDGLAVRVPVLNVSLIDLSIIVQKKTTVLAINECLKNASEGMLKHILVCNTLPLVSVDFNHHPASAIVDSTQTKVIGNLVKVLAWYDNEWGFSNRMLDTTLALAAVGY
jgi:glyceraldehyde 3-phosphate dehydrogenase